MITENNESARTISGRFKVVLEDISSGGEVMITDGVFNNVCYTVIEQ